MEFTVKTTLKAPAQTIYNAWLTSAGHSEMTGGEASITDKIGEPFTAWDGYIEGVNLALEPNRRIVQSWRTSQFDPDEADSQIEVLLVETDGVTEITLNHSKLSDNGGHYKQGWFDHYLEPMQEFFQP